MSPFKYRSEFGIVMYLSKYQILQQQELDYFVKNQNKFTEENPCNLYFILKRPRVTINPDYFKKSDEYFEVELKIQVRDKFIPKVIRIGHSKLSDAVSINAEYPYNYFKLNLENGQAIQTKVGALVDILQHEVNEVDPLLDYEVLYIGQAYGEDGKRTAIDRIPEHSTLQKIYNEAIINSPDSEIWIMLCSFEQKNIAHTNGRINTPIEFEAEDIERLAKFSNPDDMAISEHQRINFTEAALINLFKPKFNKDFKNTFPSPAHDSYSECYDLDINGIGVEMDMSSYNRWLYSDDLPRGTNTTGLFKYWQHGKFHFIDREDRYKMFNNEYL